MLEGVVGAGSVAGTPLSSPAAIAMEDEADAVSISADSEFERKAIASGASSMSTTAAPPNLASSGSVPAVPAGVGSTSQPLSHSSLAWGGVDSLASRSWTLAWLLAGVGRPCALDAFDPPVRSDVTQRETEPLEPDES